MTRLFAACLCAMSITVSPAMETPDEIATKIVAPLLDPVKVATLKGDRPINTRLYKVLYWIETAKKAGGDVSTVIDIAQMKAGYGGSTGAKADKQAILWSLKNLESWGCFNPEGMEKLRKGGSPAITRGENIGDTIALDHVLPCSIVPELAARYYNLEALPSKKNLLKSAKITQREVNLARRWNKEKLLSVNGLRAIENALNTP